MQQGEREKYSLSEIIESGGCKKAIPGRGWQYLLIRVCVCVVMR
jgi:hypothetical protein